MTKQTETNKKLPKPAPSKVDGEYPYVYAERTTNGRSYVRHDNPNKPDESFESTMHHDGSYVTNEISSSFKGMKTKLTHEGRDYTSGGHSTHVDGHKDTNVESTSNENVKGDKASGVGEVRYHGANKTVGGSKEGAFEIIPGGNKHLTTVGDCLHEFEGNQSTSVKGNVVSAVNGTKVDMINGEYGVHVQGSHNLDIRVEGGKSQIFSESDMKFKSDTKITLECGTSQIILEPGKITIRATLIEFVKA